MPEYIDQWVIKRCLLKEDGTPFSIRYWGWLKLPRKKPQRGFFQNQESWQVYTSERNAKLALVQIRRKLDTPEGVTMEVARCYLLPQVPRTPIILVA